MRAVVVNEPGGPEKLVPSEVPTPTPGPGEVVARVTAAGLNYIDTYHRSGLYPMEFPLIPGIEGAGTVESLGEGVTDLAPGDRIAWSSAQGTYAEQVVVLAEKAVPLPDAVDDEVAAAVLLQGLTAHYLAVDTFPLHPGHTCLIHAGAGGVGLLLTQIAKMRGARVITTVGSGDKVAMSREAGADDVIVYTEVDFGVAVEDLLGPHSLDVVYDGVGAATFDQGIDLLRPRGTMVTFGNASGPVPPVSPLTLMQKGSIFLTRPTMGHYLLTRDELLGRVTDLFDWVGSGSLTVQIGARYPLEEAARAHQALESRATTGKVLLIP